MNKKIQKFRRKKKKKKKVEDQRTPTVLYSSLSQERAPMQIIPSPRDKTQPTTFLPLAPLPFVGDAGAEVFVLVLEVEDGVFAGDGAEAGGLAPNNSSGNNTMSTW